MLKRFVILSLLLLVAIKAQTQQWVINYPADENENIFLIGGDVSAEYNYSVGYRNDKGLGITNPMAICVDKDGNYKDKLYDDIASKGFFCFALGLGDGNAFVVARCGDDNECDLYEKLWVAVINPDLEIIVDNYIKLKHPYVSYGMNSRALVDDDGEFIVVAQVTDFTLSVNNDMHYDYVFYKINNECEILECSYIENNSPYNEISDFTIVPNMGKYAIFGRGMRANGVETVFYVDDDLDYVSSDFIDAPLNYPNNIFPKFMCVDHWFDESHFLMSVQSSNTSGVNKWYPLVLKMNTNMKVVDVLSLERLDTTDYVSQFGSMTYIDTCTIYISTFWNTNKNATPNTATIFLIDEDLNIKGKKVVSTEAFLNVLYIQPTYDKGCIIQGYSDNTLCKVPVIYKFAKSDFEITTDVMSFESIAISNAYPNPVSSVLNIDVGTLKCDGVNVKIFDMLGRRYLDKDICINGNVLSIDVSELISGIYVCYLNYSGNLMKNIFVKE